MHTTRSASESPPLVTRVLINLLLWVFIFEDYGRGAGLGRGLGVGGSLGVGVGVPVGVGVGLGTAAQYLPPVLRSFPVLGSYPAQTIISLLVHTAAWFQAPSGVLDVLVAIQLSVLGLYLPPVLKLPSPTIPPQTIISPPVQIPV
jgi:hypothetical protein